MAITLYVTQEGRRRSKIALVRLAVVKRDTTIEFVSNDKSLKSKKNSDWSLAVRQVCSVGRMFSLGGQGDTLFVVSFFVLIFPKKLLRT